MTAKSCDTADSFREAALSAANSVFRKNTIANVRK
jgi:hypothetical protein